MFKKNIISYVLSFILLSIVIFYVTRNERYLIIFNGTVLTYLISALFGFCGFSLSGYQYYLIRKEYNVTLNRSDIILFPIVQHLWSIILPIQGSLIFSTLFFKLKYKMRMADSFSLNMYIYVITASFTGMIGLIYSILNSDLVSLFAIISFILMINPLCVFLFIRIAMTIPESFAMINKIKSSFLRVFGNIHQLLWKNKRFTFINFLFNIARSVLLSFWYLWIAWNLKIDMPYYALFMLSLIMQMTLIIKLTPANLGVAQIISGGFTSMMGYNFSDGMIISLYATLSNFLLISTIGIYGNIKYLKDFNINNFFKLLKKVINSKNIDTISND